MGWTIEGSGFDSRQEEEVFIFFIASKTGCGAHPAPYLTNAGEGSGGKAAGSVKLIAHPHLMLNLRMCGGIPPFNDTCSWRGA
jgi:hypothetical protein